MKGATAMSIYSAPSISGYNDTPPSDDGANTSANEVTWAGIKTKLGDPVKTYAQAVSSAVGTAFGKIMFNTVSAESSDYTVAAGDRGKLLSCTNTITITLLASATAANGFPLGIVNSGSGVITVDGYSSETINGYTTYTLYAGDMLVIVCDGSNWIGQSTGNPSGLAVASGYTKISANYAINNTPTEVGLTLGSGSNYTNTITAPTNATYVDVLAYGIAVGAGSTALRYVSIFDKDTNIVATVQSYEVTSASTQKLSSDSNKVILPVSSGSFVLKCSGDTGGNSYGLYRIIGYYF